MPVAPSAADLPPGRQVTQRRAPIVRSLGLVMGAWVMGAWVMGACGSPEGFESVTLQIFVDSAADLPAHELCVWEAATPAQRTRGLMGVTDLAGRAGMVFVYTEDRRTSFTMRNTLIPLSIAFFDADGFYMDAFDMEPCGGEPCPAYRTPEGFRLALEVPAGELARWGVGPGARAQRASDCHTPSS